MKRKVMVIVMMLGAAVVCMKTGSTLAAASLNDPVPGSAQRGQKVYGMTCLACHQADASGVPGMTPPLQKSPYVQGSPVKLIGIVLNGLHDGVEIDGNSYTNPMPAFSSVLKDQQIADVLTYLRSNFGNKAGAITVGQVTKIRQGINK